MRFHFCVGGIGLPTLYSIEDSIACSAGARDATRPRSMCMPAPIHVVIESIGYRIRLDLQSEMPVLRWQQMSFR